MNVTEINCKVFSSQKMHPFNMHTSAEKKKCGRFLKKKRKEKKISYPVCPIVFYRVLLNGCPSITLVSFVKWFQVHADIHILKKTPPPTITTKIKQQHCVSLWHTGLNSVHQILKFVRSRLPVVRFKELCADFSCCGSLCHVSFNPCRCESLKDWECSLPYLLAL